LNKKTLKHYDVAILGSGVIGLFCGWKLSTRGLSVIVLEKGGKTPKLPNDNFIYLKERYNGAVDGRRVGLGGTSRAWGGALIPSQKSELLRIYDENFVNRLLAGKIEVEKFFGLDNSTYENSNPELMFFSDFFKSRSAKWVGVKNKNTLNRVKKLTRFSKKPKIIIDAHIVKWHFENSRIVGIDYQDSSSDSKTVFFDNLVFATGAVGNVELIANVCRNLNQTIPSQLGKNLSDHLSVPILELNIPRKLETYFSRHFGQKFVKQTFRRDFRIESSWRENNAFPAFFLHFTQEGMGAFKLIRRILASIENKQKIHLKDILSFLLLFPSVVNLIYYRLRFKSLRINSAQKIICYCVIEKPTNENCQISGLEVNVDSRNGLEIRWEVLESDLKPVCFIQDILYRDLIAKYLQFGVSISKVAIEKPTGKNYEGIYHPTGVTRSDSKDGEGVVSLEGKVHGFENLFSLSTGNLPRGGGPNPTMNALLIANLACLQILECSS
jgi:hypothetical protein